jgi:hypothetical protein
MTQARHMSHAQKAAKRHKKRAARYANDSPPKELRLLWKQKISAAWMRSLAATTENRL